jgi:hypothetical protein
MAPISSEGEIIEWMAACGLFNYFNASITCSQWSQRRQAPA